MVTFLDYCGPKVCEILYGPLQAAGLSKAILVFLKKKEGKRNPEGHPRCSHLSYLTGILTSLDSYGSIRSTV